MQSRRNSAALSLFATLLLAAYGLWVVASGQAVLRGRNGGVLVLAGFDALLYAVCVLALAAAIHAFNVWPRTARLADYADLAAGASLVVLIVSVGWLVARQFLNFV